MIPHNNSFPRANWVLRTAIGHAKLARVKPYAVAVRSTGAQHSISAPRREPSESLMDEQQQGTSGKQHERPEHIKINPPAPEKPHTQPLIRDHGNHACHQ